MLQEFEEKREQSRQKFKIEMKEREEEKKNSSGEGKTAVSTDNDATANSYFKQNFSSGYLMTVKMSSAIEVVYDLMFSSYTVTYYRLISTYHSVLLYLHSYTN